MTPALQIQSLRITYGREGAIPPAVDSVDLAVGEGEVVGLVGESGSGKTTVASAVMGMLPPNASQSGTVQVAGRDVSELSATELRALRGGLLALVPQNPTSSLNPVLSIGYQLIETIRSHSQASRAEATEAVVAALRQVGIPDAARALRRYPHEFSGGTRQRILVAAALINSPRLIVADEPTSALDATVQRQIIDLLESVISGRRTAMLLISHDMGVVASLADRIAVMYAGQIVESGPAEEILEAPRHPYTSALLKAARGEPVALKAAEYDPRRLSTCRFLPRCPVSIDVCAGQLPALKSTTADHDVRCYVAQDEGSKRGAGRG